MAEREISKRTIFRKGAQTRFILQCKERLRLPYENLAQSLKISPRTLSDWRREKFSMPFEAVQRLTKKAGIATPKNIRLVEPFWYIATASRAGGLATYKKYGYVGGDPEKRKGQWYQWWETKGKFRKHPILYKRLPIRKPKPSQALAEFIGIELGDGGMSKRQLTITLHHINDKAYSKFVIALIKRLFAVAPRLYHDEKNSVNDIVISRTELVNFCTEKLGLKKGNKVKQQVDVPAWIKQNKRFRIACLRGLIDTDGSVFRHHYKVSKKWYQYKKLSFTSLSRPLAIFVYRTLQEIDLHPRLSRNKDVRLENSKEVPVYFHKVSTHNPKHLKRFNG